MNTCRRWVSTAAVSMCAVAATAAPAQAVTWEELLGQALTGTSPAEILDSVLATHPAQEAPAAQPSVGERIVAHARSQIGTPYAWGGATPAGFDCSGLTSWAYKQVGKDIPRTSQAQAQAGERVSEPRPGDIVAFYSGASHVGIFSGDGKIIHSPQSGDVVKEVSMNYMPIHSIVRF